MDIKRKPKFTIGVPAFKGRYLNECLESILGQSFSDFELIIIDDCSPEPLEEIVNDFVDSRINYFRNEVNTGSEKVVNNWNSCLEKATGEFFVLMGDDDRMEADYLEQFVRLIERFPDLDVYHCRSKIIDGDGNAKMLTSSWPEFENVYDNIWHRLSGCRLQYISDFVYRVDALKKKGGFFSLPLAWGSDDISAYIACGDKGIAHVNKPIFNYRSNLLSITKSGNHTLKMQAYLSYEKWLRDFLSKIPNTQEELVVYNHLMINLERLLQKRRIETIARSMQERPISKLIMWSIRRAHYKITFKEIFLGVFDNIKSKLGSKKYQ